MTGGEVGGRAAEDNVDAGGEVDVADGDRGADLGANREERLKGRDGRVGDA